MLWRSVPWVRDALKLAWDLHAKWEHHPWGDQPAIAEAIEPHSDRVRVLPQRTMNVYPDAWQPGDFILHTPGMTTAARLAALRRALGD